MVGFDDAAMMGLGAANAGVQIYGQKVQERGQKKLTALDRRGQLRHHQYDIKNMELGQEDVNRQAGLQQQDSREGDADRGMLNSSQRGYDRSQIEGNRQRNYDAIERQKTMANADWMDNESAFRLQKKMAKTQKTMGMISTMLLQGGSGVGGAMGGSTMAGG